MQKFIIFDFNELKNIQMKTRRNILFFIIITFWGIGFVACASNNKNNPHKKPDTQMVNISQDTLKEAKKLATEIKRKGISDERVLNAIAKVPRHAFIDESLRNYAYEDRPLPIEKGQTISQPFTVAFQSELLQLEPGEKVLEIGTGSGYQAAVLCEMGAEVYSIERFQELYLTAKETLNELGYHPNLFFGDGYEGLPQHAPFDKILITAAPEEVPKKLLQQLKIGGWMVLPLGGRQGQKMIVITRESEKKFTESEHGDFIFVPMQEGTEE